MVDELRWRERARAPARPASSVFVLMEPACSWRVSSHVRRPRGGWVPATRTRGRVADPEQSENYREVQSCGAGRSCSPGAVFGFVATASLPVGCPPPASPPFRAGDSTEGSSGPPRCVISLGAEVPTSGSSTKLHGVINPRALELIPIPTHS